MQQGIEHLKKIVEFTLDEALKRGATDCEVNIVESQGLDVNARAGAVETLEFNRDKALGINVYIDKRKATVGISDTASGAIIDGIEKALDIARATQPDPYAGLPERCDMAIFFPDLDLYHPWQITPEHAIEMAVKMDSYAMSDDKRIKQSDGASVSTSESIHVLGNSLGFMQHRQATRHSLSLVVIAESNGSMQRDYWYDSRRDVKDLATIEAVAQNAVERAVARLNAKSVKTQQVPVIFDAGMAAGLISNFTSGVSGGALYRKSSFLCDSLGTQIFPDHIQITEDPYVKKGLGSCTYDADGCTPQRRHLIKAGVVEGYILSSYSARRLNMPNTGNSGGPHNVLVHPGNLDLTGLIKTMGTGLYVTELMGQGVNLITGDYSRGASGFWIENGEIAFPVEQITIAGNLRDMFKGIIAAGSDLDTRGNIVTGSLLIDKMKIAGH